MTKTITSPVEEFPGTVELPNYLTFPQAMAYEESIGDTRLLIDEAMEESGLKELEETSDELEITISQLRLNSAMVKAICACVEKWDLENLEQLAPETFPATPRKASNELTHWLYSAIGDMFAPDVPNE